VVVLRNLGIFSDRLENSAERRVFPQPGENLTEGKFSREEKPRAEKRRVLKGRKLLRTGQIYLERTPIK